MIAWVCVIWSILAAPFKSERRLEMENAALRYQLVVLERRVRGRIEFTNRDQLFFILLYRWCPSVLAAMVIVRPETVVRWHRAGFRLLCVPKIRFGNIGGEVRRGLACVYRKFDST